MENQNRRIIPPQNCWKGFRRIFYAFCLMMNLFVMGQLDPPQSTVYLSQEKFDVTRSISNLPSIEIISTPLLDSEFSVLNSPSVKLTPSVHLLYTSESVSWQEASASPIRDIKSSSTSSKYPLLPFPSSFYLNIYQTQAINSNDVGEIVSSSTLKSSLLNVPVLASVAQTPILSTSHPHLYSFSTIHRDFLPISASHHEKLVYLASSHSPQPNLNYEAYSTTPVLNQPMENKDVLSADSVPPPSNWKNAEASAATAAQEAMTWITSQPSSAGHMQSEYRLPAGTVAGIVVASIGFLGILAAALGFLALKRFRPLHTKSYDSTYSGDTFSYLDNLQVSYINHNVELPKDASDEMFSLDNDSFLNSLEAMTMENYWAEDSKSTKV